MWRRRPRRRTCPSSRDGELSPERSEPYSARRRGRRRHSSFVAFLNAHPAIANRKSPNRKSNPQPTTLNPLPSTNYQSQRTTLNAQLTQSQIKWMAEGGGFEPPVDLRPHNLSKVAPSTTRTPLLKNGVDYIKTRQDAQVCRF